LPLFFQQNINANTRLAIWKIEETEAFFLAEVPVQSTITHPAKRLQHLAGRYLLIHLFPDFPHHEIEIADTRKPFLPSEQYHFSISHCSNYAAAVVSKYFRVGVDVELVTPRVEKIRHKFLHAEEARFVNSRSATDQLTYLTVMWSAKEAMFKWYALGEIDFSEDLRLFPFLLGKQGTIPAAFIKGTMQEALQLHYNLFDNLVLVYTATEPRISL
jgi:phosphopantetheinyl transferase